MTTEPFTITTTRELEIDKAHAFLRMRFGHANRNPERFHQSLGLLTDFITYKFAGVDAENPPESLQAG